MADENEFLARVEAVTSQVNDLLTNKTTITAVDRYIQKQTLLTDLKQKEKAEKAENTRLYGRPGAGNSEDYALFCRKCFTEYPEVVARCGRCGQACLVPRAERRAELQAKAQRLRQDQATRKVRKDRYAKYVSTLKLAGGATDFERWALFEDSEEEEGGPVLPRHDPQFKAMEKDIEDRAERRRRASKKGEEKKMEGNGKFAVGNFQGALESYKEGLEGDRGNKELLGNLALVEYKLGKFAEAISTASKVLDICELFEGGFEGSARLCAKALLRRANAQRELKNFAAAKDDLQSALRLQPEDAEINKHLEICEELVSDCAVAPELEKKLNEMEEISDLCQVLRTDKAAQIVFLKNPLQRVLAEMQNVAISARNSEISEKIGNFQGRLRLLEAVVAESDAAAALLLAHAYLLVDLTLSEPLRPLALSVLARISGTPAAQAELRRLYLKASAEKARSFLTSDASPEALALLTNILFGASEAEKTNFRLPRVFATIAKYLTSRDWFFVQKAAALACNLGDDRNTALMAECVETLAQTSNRSTAQNAALEHLLNAMHNATVVSEEARKSLVPKSLDLAKNFARLSVDKRTLTVLLKLGQAGADLSDESDAVALAKTALASTDLGCRDAAVRLLAYAFQKDSSVMNASLVSKLVDLIVAIKPAQYVKSASAVTPEGLLRGNVCLLLGHAADRQMLGGLTDVDLTPAIEPVILTLRMDAEAVQRNAGVALSKIARIDKYKETVRELRGFESLGQIQLKLIHK